MATELRLRLQRDFRDPLQSGAGFVGREAELARLKAILRQRRAATVLVSGHRGVGKTTLVDEALRQCRDPKTIVARLSLPHVYPQSNDHDSRDFRAQVLRSLARSLHFELKDNNTKSVKPALRKQAEDLYQKTYLKELQREGVLEFISQAETQQRVSTTTEIRLRPDRVVATILGTVLAGGVATGGVAVSSAVAAEHGWGWGALALAVILVSAVAAGTTLSRRRQTSESTAAKVIGQTSTTNIGTFDLSPETLEYELQELLTAIGKARLRTVFVIDELDKLETAILGDTGEQVLEKHVIFRLLASLKNFFTLGSGVFVFISGEDFYARLEESIESESYSLAHTLFTDRIFVHVLPYSDVERLIDGLLASPPEDEMTYRRFRNFLCWQSRDHIFDLLTLIADFVVEYDGDQPILVARESAEIDGRWQEGNLPDDWLLASALQKTVGATFDESARPGGRAERFNQALWLTLLDLARRVARDDAIVVQNSGFEIEHSRWTERLSDDDADDLAGAADRLLARAERYGILTTTKTSVTISSADGGAETEADATEYAVVVEPPYPDASIGQHGAPSPFEQGFVKVASELAVVRGHLEAAEVDVSSHEEELDHVASVAESVQRRTSRKATPRSVVRDALKRADQLLPTLVSESIEYLVRSWATSQGFEVAPSVEAPAQTATARQGTSAVREPELALAEFAQLAEILDADDDHYLLVHADATENQLLVVRDLARDHADALQRSYSDASPGRKGQQRRVQRLPIVEVRRSAPDEPLDLPREIITVADPDPSSGFIAWARSFFGGSEGKPSERKVTEQLAGWMVFALRHDASNLSDLRSTLENVSYLAVGPSDSSDG